MLNLKITIEKMYHVIFLHKFYFYYVLDLLKSAGYSYKGWFKLNSKTVLSEKNLNSTKLPVFSGTESPLKTDK